MISPKLAERESPRLTSNAPRTGSRTVARKSGATTMPAMPTTTKAKRQSTRVAMMPPKTIPSALPIGMPKE
jgi:hypothetical protein